MINLTPIVNHFAITGAVSDIYPLGEGFINDTYIVETVGDGDNRYLLQRKNRKIFTNIPAMMDNIVAVANHIKAKVVAKGGNPMREALTVVPTLSGQLYHLDGEGEYWAICLFIQDSQTYQAARTPQLAYQGGKGIGMFQAMVADLTTPLTDILPGFHNIRYRFEQWDQALASDAAGRKASVQPEIEWVESRREEMLRFWSLVEDGAIPTRVTHNDTKINNILFDLNGEVLCAIDLDTVLNSTCLNDFGDAIRSYTNTGLEDDTNLDSVSMSMPIFEAYTKGYLSQTIGFLTPTELEYLAFSAKYITFEQVLRFLMDYINGDTYYKVKHESHNLERTRAQYKLLSSIDAQFEQMREVVSVAAKEYGC